METKVSVWCTTQFEGWHRWMDAPHEFAYLRCSHRHMFHVKVQVTVQELDRQIEFIDLKHKVEELLGLSLFGNTSQSKPAYHSCEMMAKELGQALQLALNTELITVTVSEDGENGATVELG